MVASNMVTLFILGLALTQCPTLSIGRKIVSRNPNFFTYDNKSMEFINSNNESVTRYRLRLSRMMTSESIRNISVRLLADNMDPYIISSPGSQEISGFLGDVWHILEDYIDMRVDITTISDFDEGFATVARNEADILLSAAVHYGGFTDVIFSQPYFSTWYHVYYKLPEGKPSLYIHFNIFSPKIRVAITLFYLFLTLSLWFTCTLLKKVSRKGEILLSPLTYFMGLVSSFFNTGYDLRLRSCAARVQIFTAMVFGLLCYYALAATLVARLAVLDRPMPFENLQDVAVKKTHILCVRNVSFVYRNFTDDKRQILPDWQRVVNVEHCPDISDWRSILKIVCKDKLAFFENRIIMSLVENHKNLTCQVTHLPERITKLRSSGILEKLERDWVRKYPDIESSPRPVNQITFDHVKGLICIYFMMALASWVILILEIAYERYWVAHRPNSTNPLWKTGGFPDNQNRSVFLFYN